MHIVFHRRKKSFLIIEMKLRHCLTLQNTEKTILLYITVTVNRETYLGIDQSMKRKFVTIAANTRKSRIFDTDLVFVYDLFLYFPAWSNFIIIAETTTFPKIKF